MKKNNVVLFLLAAVLVTIMLFAQSCIKPEMPGPRHHETPLQLPLVYTEDVTDITLYSASCGGMIVSDYGFTITARGVCWGTDTLPTINDFKTMDGTGMGNYYSMITGLQANTKYFIRAYAESSEGIGYGNCLSFKTFTAVFGPGFCYQGGIIACIFQPGEPGYIAGETHGIIAAPNDMSEVVDWSNESFITTNATATALSTGLLNTNMIVTAQGNGNYAAKLCLDLVVNGFSDWFLPSKDELTKLYLNKDVIGGFNGTSYWSSSETGSSSAWRRSFKTGIEYDNWKATIYNIRAVRYF
jgi:hypothetical protein